MLSGAILVLAVVTVLLLGLRVVGKGERLAIMRLGQFVGIRGPGVVLALPFLDQITRINLDRDIPSWRALSTEELAEEIHRRLTT